MPVRSLKQLAAKKKPLTTRVEVINDPEFAEKWQAAKTALEAAQSRFDRTASEDNSASLAEAQNNLDDLADEHAKATVTFVFQAIGRKRFEALSAEYPATKEQIKEARRIDPHARLQFDYEAFSKALIAESLVEPTATLEDVQELFDSPAWNDGELAVLIAAAFDVNSSSKVVSVSKGSGTTTS